MLEVRLLGRFEIRHGKKTVDLSSRQAQTLFAFLILNAGTTYRREKLAGQLWPDSTEEGARDYLRHALWRIRKALQPISASSCLKANDLTVSFDASSKYWLDTAALQEADEAGSIHRLADALSGYTAELLPGFYDEWVASERERLQAVYERKVGCLLELLYTAGDWKNVIAWAEKWIALGQKPESAYRYLMSAYAAMGDMSKVAATYQRCVKSLKEFGFEPSEQTRAMYQRLKAGKESFETEPASLLKEKRQESPRTNLPVPLTSFIGREKEVQEVAKLVGTNRLVTLTGPGGVGKTRLAIQSSSKMLNEFKDGVWWVELAPLMDEALVPQAVAQALGIHEYPGQALAKSVKVFLHDKHLLLVLDNCEHLIVGSAQLAYDLLTGCANLRILATSREMLDITGEITYQVPTLSLPKPETLALADLLLEYESIRLFVERAYQKSGFKITEQNAVAVLQICQRLDGIPLALELAAARTRMLTAEQIADRLNDRFNLLIQGSRTVLPRHQTLRAAIDWSYDLLSEEEQTLFRRLAVFAGGWTLGAAHGICSGDGIPVDKVLDLLTNLVDKSLVITQEQDGETRYQMLETIRLYAHGKMLNAERNEQLCDLHLNFFLGFAEVAELHLLSAEAPAWLDRVQHDWDNLRFAIRWSLKRDRGEKGLRIASALVFFAYGRGYLREFYQVLQELLKSQGAAQRTTALGKGFFVVAAVEVELGNFPDAHPHYEESIAILREAGEGGRSLLETVLSYFAHALLWSEPRAAARRAEEAVQLCRESGNHDGLALALNRLGEARYWMNDGESARALIRESATIAQEIGNQFAYHVATANLGVSEFFDGDLDAARQDLDAFDSPWMKSYKEGTALANEFLGAIGRLQRQQAVAETRLEEAVRILREVGEKRYFAMALVFLGRLKLDKGDRDAAQECFRQAFSLALEANAWILVSWSLESFAYLSLTLDQSRRAVRLLGSAEAWREQLGTPVAAFEREEHESALVRAHAQLDQASFEAAWAEGRAMTLEQATAFALEETSE